MDALRHLSRITVDLNGRPVELWLQVPTAGFELPLLPSGPLDDNQRRHRLSVLFAGFIESIDGAPPSRDQRLALTASAASSSTLLELRAKLYDDVRLQGHVHLGCPRCAAESQIDLVTLALTLGPNPWPVADRDGWPAIPSLALPQPLGARPSDVPRAVSARLTLPSARLGLRPRPFSETALDGPVTPERDAEGRRRWSLEDKPFDPERSHWTWGNTGFRATLRLALSLARLDDTRDVQPELIERMPVTDVLFADAVHHYLRIVPIREAARATIVCGACKQPFLAAL